MTIKLLSRHFYEPEVEQPAGYYIRGLTGLEWLEMQEIMRRTQGEEALAEALKGGQFRLEAPVIEYTITRGVVDWDDRVAGAEDDLPACTPENIKALPLDHILDLALTIIILSQLSEEEAKNSLSRSKSGKGHKTSTAKDADLAVTAPKKLRLPKRSSKSKG